jgi:putative peptidoglycan lipid II flippase
MALSEPVVRLLFEHGAFAATDTTGTAHALVWLALGLPAQVLIKALSPAFFARGDTSTPLWATLKGLVVTIILAIVLGRLFDVGGIAASIAIGAWSAALVLIRRGLATFGFSIDAAARRRLPRIVAAALAMGSLLWLSAPLALASAANASAPLHLLLVAALIAGGIAVYGLFLALLGVTSWVDAIRALRQTGA